MVSDYSEAFALASIREVVAPPVVDDVDVCVFWRCLHFPSVRVIFASRLPNQIQKIVL